MLEITIEVDHNLIEELQNICDADNMAGANEDTSEVLWTDDGKTPVKINWVQHEDEKLTEV